MFTYNISEGIKAYEERREHWGTIAEQAKTAFVDTFLNDHGYLYD